MEKDQRALLGDAVIEARRLLEQDCAEQLEGVYNIMPDGTLQNRAPGDPAIRGRLLDVIQHYRAAGADAKEAVYRLVRETAFTTLNRFAALKLAERRGIVRECVSQSRESKGVKELADLAPGLRAVPDGGYRLLLEGVMDEISVNLGILFDRRSALAIVWPGSRALERLLHILNDEALVDLWTVDETIGWIYQYFNADDVKEMREASPSPRDSSELAVRNQFFTPRYVVAFLADNTLGRTWYEMMQGRTALKEHCHCLQCPPTDMFLPEGRPGPERDPSTSSLPGEVLSERDIVEFRAKKDPRDLRILDPAVGSGHFLLYAFELLLTIYAEAWADTDAPASSLTGTRLRQDYPDLNTLNAAVPELILRYNLHGIEIDPRCAQIASFALWLRAQRAWSDIGLAGC